MGTVIPSPASPNSLLSDVLLLARIKVDDVQNTIDGEMLAITRPYVMPMVSNAWRKLQRDLTARGYEYNTREQVYTGFPATDDPTLYSFMSRQGSGAGNYEYETPALPDDIDVPLDVWVSPTTDNSFRMVPVTSLPQYPDNSCFEWRGDSLYFYGMTLPVNLRLRYTAVMPSFYSFTQQVPIRFCEDAFALLIAEEYVGMTGGGGLDDLQQRRELAVQDLVKPTARKNQRMNLRRRGYGGDGGYRQYPGYIQTTN